jgi:hypothetical protein
MRTLRTLCCMTAILLVMAVIVVYADQPTGAENLTLAQNNSRHGRGNPLDQGGETCATAMVIPSLPFCDRGTTVGHVNDYNPPCDGNSRAPDVVYSFHPTQQVVISASLCGSSYRTLLHIE